MISPDSICEIHGTVKAETRRRDGRLERYCNACRRARARWNGKPVQRHNGGPICFRGHVKTPWSWRWHKATKAYYCHTCQLQRKRERRLDRAA